MVILHNCDWRVGVQITGSSELEVLNVDESNSLRILRTIILHGDISLKIRIFILFKNQ
jgi:hypothetical protein